jgi:urease accessory protein
MNNIALGSLLALGLAALCIPAQAHTGHGLIADFAGGALHPVGGIDHLLIMLAVGLWAARLGGRAMWLLPASFLAMMAAGAWLTYQGLGLAEPETAIRASLLAVGAALVSGVGLKPLPAAALVGVFALFHGAAHARELAAGDDALAYGLGFLATTAALHGAGLVAGCLVTRRLQAALYRLFGWMCAGTGVYLLAAG